jgi:hypothetical protein
VEAYLDAHLAAGAWAPGTAVKYRQTLTTLVTHRARTGPARPRARPWPTWIPVISGSGHLPPGHGGQPGGGVVDRVEYTDEGDERVLDDVFGVDVRPQRPDDWLRCAGVARRSASAVPIAVAD